MATITKRPAKPPGNLTPLEFAAIAIAGKEAKNWRDLVDAVHGQKVDFVVWIKGEVHVGEDQTATVRTKPDVEELLAHVLTALGPKTRESVIEALLAAHAEALNGANRHGKPKPIAADAADSAKRTIELLTVTRTQERAGNVSGTLAIAKASR